MKCNLHNIVNLKEFENYRNQLSSEAKYSTASNAIENYYKTVEIYFAKLRESLNYCRDENGNSTSVSYTKLKPSSSRLQFELIALVTEFLVYFPNLEPIINADSNANDTDKILLKAAYQNLKSQIQSLKNMYGQACFGFKKDEEQVEK